jgi:hypothetical protein
MQNARSLTRTGAERLDHINMVYCRKIVKDFLMLNIN